MNSLHCSALPNVFQTLCVSRPHEHECYRVINSKDPGSDLCNFRIYWGAFRSAKPRCPSNRSKFVKGCHGVVQEIVVRVCAWVIVRGHCEGNDSNRGTMGHGNGPATVSTFPEWMSCSWYELELWVLWRLCNVRHIFFNDSNKNLRSCGRQRIPITTFRNICEYYKNNFEMVNINLEWI